MIYNLNISLYLQYSSFLYVALILIVFLIRKKSVMLENKIYTKLLIGNLLGLLIVIVYALLLKYTNTASIIAIILFKLLLCYLFLWVMIYTIYIYVISKQLKYDDKVNNSLKWNKYIRFNIILIFLSAIFCILIMIFPLKFMYDNNGIYVNPNSISYILVYGIVGGLFILWINLLYSSDDKTLTAKYYPIYLCMIFATIASFFQYIKPYIALMTVVQSFISVFIYFTMENPDIKLVEYERTEKERANKLSENKTKFLSSMSQELRTPLASIIGLGEDLELNTNNCSKEVKDDAKDITNAANTLMEIIGGILDISKIEGGSFDITPSDYDPKFEFETLAKIMRTKVAEKPLEFKVNISENIPETLYGDRVRIKQIINNLLSNAIKYTDKGEVNFDVTWLDASGSLFIKVSDTGRGVKPEDIDRLFAKYDRLSVEKVSAVQGTGLGLAITRDLIECMGGKIEVSSVFGEGTTFSVTLPQNIGSHESLELAKKSEKFDYRSVNLSGKKILIVDDNLLNIKVLKKTIKTLKLDIDECYNGKEAIAKIDAGYKYDLILLDILMPDMDGEITIKRLKEKENFNTPVIAVTSDAMTGAREKYLSLGFNKYISKPFTRDTIIKEIYDVINIRK